MTKDSTYKVLSYFYAQPSIAFKQKCLEVIFMALTDDMLQDLIKGLSAEQRKKLFKELGKQIKVDNIKETAPKPKGSEPVPRTRPVPADENTKVYCCPICGSASYIKIGFTNKGIQRYKCKDCNKRFSENYGDSNRGTHLTDEQWKIVIAGVVYDHSLRTIADDAGIAKSTAWQCRIKLNQAIATMYGYNETFKGTTQADEYYYRASFKGKRDPEFFIKTLDRMPRHHYTYSEKIDWLKNNGLYDYVVSKYSQEPRIDSKGNYKPSEFDEFLEGKMKRGISNDQICILTIVDDTGKSYIEPVSVGRLEQAMAKSKVKPRLEPDKSNVLVTDEHNAYNRITYGTYAKHEVVKADQHRKGKYNLAKVNSLHSLLDEYMNKYNHRAFTTKYLDLHVMLFWWLCKYKDYSNQEKIDALFSILNDQIPDIELREKVNQVTLDELKNREITLDTKGEFPRKL